MRGHVDPLASKANPLHFQQPSLQQGSLADRKRIHQNLPSGADDALPRQSLGAAVHSPTDLARHIGRSQQHRNLSVGEHLAAWNCADDPIDPFEEVTIATRSLAIGRLTWRSFHRQQWNSRCPCAVSGPEISCRFVIVLPT